MFKMHAQVTNQRVVNFCLSNSSTSVRFTRPWTVSTPCNETALNRKHPQLIYFDDTKIHGLGVEVATDF
jgi:hypothetical protein